MLALAQAWQKLGGQVQLVTNSDCPAPLVQRCQAAGLLVERLTAPTEDAAGLRRKANQWGAMAVVVDGYHFTESYQETLAGAAWPTLWMDDFDHCQSWNCDWVVNQNLHGEALKLKGRAKLLGGVKFALLREDLLALDACLLPAKAIQRILVSLGGADPDNVSSKILQALHELSGPSLEITVLVGAANPHLMGLMELASSSRHTCQILSGVTEMGQVYEQTDGVIGAGGTTCYEWLYFGLPAFVLTLADNQVRVVEELSRQHLAVCGGWGNHLSATELRTALQAWLAAPVRDEAQRVDGQGAWRVAQVLAGHAWAVRAACRADLNFTLQLANEPSVRSAGFNQEPIPQSVHQAWFFKHLAEPKSRLFIIEEPAIGPVGVVRAHWQGEGWELGVSLAPAARGRSLARLALAEVMERMKHAGEAMFIARIRPENQASQHLFSRLGFRPGNILEDCIVYHLPVSA